MKLNNFIRITIIILLFFSCSKKDVKQSIIKEKSLESQVSMAYKEGVKSLEAGDILFAAKKFNEVEILFPQSIWAPRAAIWQHIHIIHKITIVMQSQN